MRSNAILAVLLAGPLLNAAVAPAQQIPSPYRFVEQKHSFGVSAGYLVADPTMRLRKQDVEFGPRSAPVVAARYGYRLGGPATFAGGVAFAATERKLYAPLTVESDSLVAREVGTAELALAIVDVSLVLHLTGQRTWNGIAPYLLGSGGVAAELGGKRTAEEVGGSRYEFGPSFAVGGGAGVEWFPTRRLSVRAEVHDRLWKLEVPEGYLPATRRGQSEWTHNAAFTLGAALHF